MENIVTGIYIRVSTEEQAKEGFSLAAQEEKLRYFAENIRSWKVLRVYCDSGISGKSINNRPGLLEMLDDVRTGIINNVLIYKIDRITRSTKDLIELVDLFNTHNCSFNSLTECIDTNSATGRMFIKIIGTFAEFERENIVERIKIGLERKVHEGYSLCSSNVSYGYTRNIKEKVQHIETKEADVVRLIYKMFAGGVRIGKIVKYLNTENILTKKGKKWNHRTIKLILTNPNYIGKVRYGINTEKYFETIGNHQSIISKSLYEKTHDKLKMLKRNYEDAYYTGYLCCSCGKKMTPKRTYYKEKCYIYYKCSESKCKGVSQKQLDNMIEYRDINWSKIDIHNRYIYLSKHVNKIIFDAFNNVVVINYSI